MTVLGFIPDSDAADMVIAWTEALADENEQTEYIALSSQENGEFDQTIKDALSRAGLSDSHLTAISSLSPIVELQEKCGQTKARRIVASAFDFQDPDGRPQSSEELLRSSPCEAFVILSGTKTPADLRKTMVMTTGGSHDLASIRLAEALRGKFDTKNTLATVETASDALGERAGKRDLKSLLHDAALNKKLYETKVVVDRKRRRGILKCFDQHDLIITGRDDLQPLVALERFLGDTTIIIVKRTPALSFRALPQWLPRIHPGDHADLLHNLRQGSRWNHDFIWMLGLAAAIASLGLMQNSPAVVIGSMLLAPLMTPMIGFGLAIAEAASRMAEHCARSIARGFLLTLGVSILIGLITPSRETLSPEILSRGDPNILDLLIAVFAAMAATIAMARPNIAGAIAGVAIATALVPPVCAIGLSLSHGAIGNALGATVLFVTNLIAIVVASSFTFSLMGVTSSRSIRRHRSLARLAQWVLVGALVVLAGPLSSRLLHQLDEGRPQTAVFPVTREVSRELHEHVAKQPGVDLTFMGRSAVTDAIVIHIATDHQLSRSYANQLRDVVRTTMEDPEMPVVIVAFDGQWRSDQEEPEPRD